MSIKHFIALLLFTVLTASSAQAGMWKQHRSYVGSSIQNLYDAGDKVYYMNCNKLFQFDKSTCQTKALGRHNGLAENTVAQIYYDWENRLLFVSYDDSNIDVIDSNGAVTNIPNIKDYVARVHNATFDEDNYILSYADKTIRDITFAKGNAYVTIGYGYAIVDESTFQITQFTELGKSVTLNSVAVMGNMLVITTNTNIYYGPIGQEDPIHTYKHRSSNFTDSRLYPIDSISTFVLNPTLSRLYRYEMTSPDAAATYTKLVESIPTSVQKTPNGYIANFAGESFYYTIDATGKTATQASTIAEFASCDPLGDGTVWINDADGLHADGSSTTYATNTLSMSQPYWLKYNAAINKLYVANSGPNMLTVNTTTASNAIDTYDGTTWQKNTPYTSKGGGYEFVFCPSDPTTYVRASWSKGVHKVTNDQLVTVYNQTNAPFGSLRPQPAFDKQGNLWVVTSYNDTDCPVAVLPADKFAKTSVSKKNWFKPEGLWKLGTSKMQGSRFLISKKNNVKFYFDGDLSMGQLLGSIICFDNHNDDPTVGNYDIINHNNFIDQNGISVGWLYPKHMEEDKDGLIWVGHMSGLFAFDPDEAFNPQPRCIRPHAVDIESGESHILCEGFAVYDFGIDSDNNKWIATGGDGLFFVSPDGTKIFEHLTTRNSDIPSDIVYCVECDTVNNHIYVVTDAGVAEYIPGENAVATNYDNVYVYPNPVKPDFTGYIEINELMSDSYVTITDRNHNIVAQLGPVSGQALWDGIGTDGNFVPTGMYNVYAAQGTYPDTTGAPMATVLIIK